MNFIKEKFKMVSPPTFVNKTDKVLTLSIVGYIDTVERCEIKSHTSRKVQDSKICDTQGQDLNRIRLGQVSSDTI